MNKAGRYKTSHLPEDQFEPGSQGHVLKNMLGVKNKQEMHRIEARRQLRTINEISKLFGERHRFTAEDVRAIHKIWLGGIYPWAGQYRQVNISKGDFPFAAAGQVPELMEEFERGPLRKFTPCRSGGIEPVAEALAVVHVELVLIHPFREGSGRAARLLSILMGWQARLPTLDFGGIKGKMKEEYFAAVREGVKHDYQPMVKIFQSVIARTLRNIRKE